MKVGVIFTLAPTDEDKRHPQNSRKGNYYILYLLYTIIHYKNIPTMLYSQKFWLCFRFLNDQTPSSVLDKPFLAFLNLYECQD